MTRLTTTKELGNIGENAASEYLINRNYRIIHRNFRVGRFGEIDIIAEEQWSKLWPFSKKHLVFVEVKTTTKERGISEYAPELHVDNRKQLKLMKLANLYMAKSKINLDTPWRIDVVAVDVERSTGNILDIRHHKNAVFL